MKAIFSLLFISLSLFSVAQVGNKELTPTKKSKNPIIKGKVRKTLIIGNSNYINLKQLQVCEMDADSIGKRLINFNFSPIIRKNLNFEGMKSEFEASIDSLPPQSEVIIYFSGHGLHVGEKDYLLPIDFMADCLNYTSKIDEKAISLQWIMNKLSKKQISNSVIILDACRNILSDCENYCLGSSFNEASNLPNIAVLFASSNCQKSGYPSLNPTNSYFTSGLLYALNFPQLPLGEVFSKAYSKTVQITNENNYFQKPFGVFQSGGMIINNSSRITLKTESKCINLKDTENTYVQTGTFKRVYDNATISLGMSRIQAQNNAYTLLGNRILAKFDLFNESLNHIEILNNIVIEKFKSDIELISKSSFQINGAAKQICEDEFGKDYYLTIEVPKVNINNLIESKLKSTIPKELQEKEIIQLNVMIEKFVKSL